jgi:hypothetical protein
VERIKEYLELDQEAPAKVARPPPARWPCSDGGIDVENLVVRYAPHLPAVLKGISFSIRPHEKVGVVRILSDISEYFDLMWGAIEGWKNGFWKGGLIFPVLFPLLLRLLTLAVHFGLIHASYHRGL